MLDLPDPFYALGEHIAIDLPGARAVFTTRHGGVSKPPYDGLNLGPRVQGDRDGAAENEHSDEERVATVGDRRGASVDETKD